MRALPLPVPPVKDRASGGLDVPAPLVGPWPRVESIDKEMDDGPLGSARSLEGPVGFKPRRSGGESRNKACWCWGTRIQLPGLRGSVGPLLNPGPGDCHGRPFLAIRWSQRTKRMCVTASDSHASEIIAASRCRSKPGVWLQFNQFILAFLQPKRIMRPFPDQNVTLYPQIVAMVASIGGSQLPLSPTSNTIGLRPESQRGCGWSASRGVQSDPCIMCLVGCLSGRLEAIERVVVWLDVPLSPFL